MAKSGKWWFLSTIFLMILAICVFSFNPRLVIRKTSLQASRINRLLFLTRAGLNLGALISFQMTVWQGGAISYRSSTLKWLMQLIIMRFITRIDRLTVTNGATCLPIASLWMSASRNKWRFLAIPLPPCHLHPPDTRGGNYSGHLTEPASIIKRIKSAPSFEIPSSTRKAISDVMRNFPAVSRTEIGIIKARYYKGR